MSTLAQAVSDLTKGILSEMHTSMPGTVEDYEPSTQKASVKPLLRRKYLDGTSVSFPVISEVPVLFPASGGASLTFPVQKGDTVLIIFSERTLENWLTTGNEGDTSAEIQFDLNDAIAIPGLMDFTKTSPAENNTDVSLSFNNQKIIIKPNGNIELGVGVLQNLVDARFIELFNAHTHPVPALGVSSVPSVPVSAPLCTTNKVSAI